MFAAQISNYAVNYFERGAALVEQGVRAYKISCSTRKLAIQIIPAEGHKSYTADDKLTAHNIRKALASGILLDFGCHHSWLAKS